MIRAVYSFMTNEKRIAFFRKCDGFLRRHGGRLYLGTLGQLKYRLRFRRNRQPFQETELAEGEQSFCLMYEKEPQGAYRPLVSIFMAADKGISPGTRAWDTVYRQTYDNVEILLPKNGKALAGLAQAKGELIWIIEENAVCSMDFLEKMVPLFRYRSVMTALSARRISKLRGETVPDASEWYITAFDLLRHMERGEFSVPPVWGCLFRNGRDLADILENMPLDKLGNAQFFSLYKRGGVVACTEKILYQGQTDALIRPEPSTRKAPGIIMACYSLKSGGGEIFPIYLANALKKLGAAVTLLNFGLEEDERQITELVDGGIPLVHLRHTDDIAPILYHLGGGIVHTHHAVVDYAVSMCLGSNPGLGRQVITLHGMYETMAREDCDRVIRAVLPICRTYAYVADKNLQCFRARGKYKEENFVKIPPGIPGGKTLAIERSRLGLDEDDFVFVLASRGIPEKGWREAIQALDRAQAKCSRRLQLVILGDGEIRGDLEQEAPENVHFMGTVGNVRSYFAMGDAGLLPTMYAGESNPLVVMECLMCGKPMIATDIGEIGNQLRDSRGHVAGMLLTLRQGKIDEAQLAQYMCTLAEHPAAYGQLRQAAELASEKFDIHMTAAKYLQLYRREVCEYPLGKLHKEQLIHLKEE